MVPTQQAVGIEYQGAAFIQVCAVLCGKQDERLVVLVSRDCQMQAAIERTLLPATVPWLPCPSV